MQIILITTFKQARPLKTGRNEKTHQVYTVRYNRKGSSRFCNQILSKLKDKIVFRFNNLLIDEGPLTKVIQSSDATTRKHEQCKYVVAGHDFARVTNASPVVNR